LDFLKLNCKLSDGPAMGTLLLLSYLYSIIPIIIWPSTVPDARTQKHAHTMYFLKEWMDNPKNKYIKVGGNQKLPENLGLVGP